MSRLMSGEMALINRGASMSFPGNGRSRVLIPVHLKAFDVNQYVDLREGCRGDAKMRQWLLCARLFG